MTTERPQEVDTSEVGAELEEQGVLPPGVRGTEASSGVLCVLAQRLSGGEARDLVASLPPGLRARVDVCARHRGERGEVFDRAEFLRRVATHLNVTEPQAEAITRAVFAVVRRRLPSKEVQDVASQLPRELRTLWMVAP
jgi:uncharacterized protein (DUF2267 family)